MTKRHHHTQRQEPTQAAATGKTKSGCLVVFLIILAFMIGRCTAPTPTPPSSPQSLTSASTSSSESDVSPSTHHKKKHAARTASSFQAEPNDTAPGYTPVPSTSDDVDNDGYYTNRDGNIVRVPHKEVSGCATSGASALCRDGTCSFSRHRSGTCSRHGGVAEWL
jgi:hypothetical protein